MNSEAERIGVNEFRGDSFSVGSNGSITKSMAYDVDVIATRPNWASDQLDDPWPSKIARETRYA